MDGGGVGDAGCGLALAGGDVEVEEGGEGGVDEEGCGRGVEVEAGPGCGAGVGGEEGGEGLFEGGGGDVRVEEAGDEDVDCVLFLGGGHCACGGG